MRHQEATTVVPLPLAAVQGRLRDVESWSKFLHGIESIRFTSHERYVFTLRDGRDCRDLSLVVKLQHRDHCFVWHELSGPFWRGSLKLAGIDHRHTAVTLALASLPTGLRSGLAEMMMLTNNAVAHLDLKLLERHLTTPELTFSEATTTAHPHR